MCRTCLDVLLVFREHFAIGSPPTTDEPRKSGQKAFDMTAQQPLHRIRVLKKSSPARQTDEPARSPRGLSIVLCVMIIRFVRVRGVSEWVSECVCVLWFRGDRDRESGTDRESEKRGRDREGERQVNK